MAERAEVAERAISDRWTAVETATYVAARVRTEFYRAAGHVIPDGELIPSRDGRPLRCAYCRKPFLADRWRK